MGTRQGAVRTNRRAVEGRVMTPGVRMLPGLGVRTSQYCCRPRIWEVMEQWEMMGNPATEQSRLMKTFCIVNGGSSTSR